MLKPEASFENFDALDIRIGKVVDVAVAATRKPTYRISVDFGSEIGTRVSCGAYRRYQVDELLGRQVVCILNFGVKKMGPEKSEVLILGVPPAGEQGTIFLTTEQDVDLGVAVF